MRYRLGSHLESSILFGSNVFGRRSSHLSRSLLLSSIGTFCTLSRGVLTNQILLQPLDLDIQWFTLFGQRSRPTSLNLTLSRSFLLLSLIIWIRYRLEVLLTILLSTRLSQNWRLLHVILTWDLARVFARLVPKIQLWPIRHLSFVKLIYRALLLALMIGDRGLNAWSTYTSTPYPHYDRLLVMITWIVWIGSVVMNQVCAKVVGSVWSICGHILLVRHKRDRPIWLGGLLLLHLVFHADQFLGVESLLVRIDVAHDQVLFLLSNIFCQFLLVLVNKFLNIYACRQILIILGIFGRLNPLFFNLNHLVILLDYTARSCRPCIIWSLICVISWLVWIHTLLNRHLFLR